jgi:peroxiredoxin
LLSDVDREVGERYETKRAPEEPSPGFAKRRTYLIDPELRIARAYRVTDIPGHPGQVLEDLRALGAITS